MHYVSENQVVNLFFCLHYAVSTCQSKPISRLVCNQVMISEKILVNPPYMRFDH